MVRLDPDQPSTPPEEAADAGARTLLSPESAEDADDTETLSDGEALTLTQASEIRGKEASRFVLLIGELDTGKTSLVSQMYSAFLKGPFAGHLFSGSQTLQAFERRCFRTRISSGAIDASFPRTLFSEGIHVLHLRLCNSSLPASPPVNLLIADTSGERFRQIRENERTEVLEISRLSHLADAIVLILDGRQLSDKRERQLAVSRLKTVIRAVREAGGINVASCVDFVITKIDLLPSHERDGTFIRDVFEELSLAIGSVHRVGHHLVAALPLHDDQVPERLGVDSLLQGWLTVGDAYVANDHSPPFPLSRPARAFLRYDGALKTKALL